MGQAKARKQEVDTAISTLTEHERIIFDLAKKMFDRVICGMSMTGGCYRITFILKEILKREHNIETEAVIGFVNDGTDDIMISHGWLEYNNKKTDLTLAKVAQGLNRGPLLILDQQFKAHGAVNYSYHRQRNEAGDKAAQLLLTSDLREVRKIAEQKEAEHKFMLEIADSDQKIMNFLDSAPDGATYVRFLETLR